MMPVPSGAGFSSTLPAQSGRRSHAEWSSLQRHANEVLFRRLDPFLIADGTSSPCRRRTRPRRAIADDDERAEAQVLAALDDLRDAVDGDDGVLDVELTGSIRSRVLI
jgi:hypothetical protein